MIVPSTPRNQGSFPIVTIEYSVNPARLLNAKQIDGLLGYTSPIIAHGASFLMRFARHTHAADLSMRLGVL